MSYCLHPDCCAPFNPEDQKICRGCGSKLLLKVRYRAIRPIAKGQFLHLFQGIDIQAKNHPLVIKQILLPYPLLRAVSQRKIAIEVLHETSEKLSRLAEAENLQRPLEYVVSGQGIYWIEEPLIGETLSEILENLPYLSEEHVHQILSDLLPTLDELHRHSLIHRAICPDNIFYAAHTGKFTLANFGLTQLIVEALYKEIPNLGEYAIADPMYSAPEQMKGRSVPASDLYSLGVVCLQALTGIEPIHLVDQCGKNWHYRDYLRDRTISDSFCQILDKMLSAALINRFLKAEEILHQLSVIQHPPSRQSVITEADASLDVFGYLFHHSAKTVADCVQSIQAVTTSFASFFLPASKED
ncbi:MAG: protein kinase [Scytolyngbya sp. HA4215-MV1]|nr:protein kinase [Scytolyngbya sp. HA4215-MV1]